MPRPPRADEAGGLYHALNRGNLKATIFQKEGDYFAFEKILSEGLERYKVELFSYQLMPNHYHLVLRPGVDGEMSRFMKWVGGTHTMRYHAHHHTSGFGHIYQQRYKSFPIQDDMTIFLWYVAMSSEMHIAADWYRPQKIGSGDRCGDGYRSLNKTPSCFLRGPFRDCLIGLNGSINR